MIVSLITEQSYLRSVLDALPTPIFVVDKDFKIYDINPAAKDLFKIDTDVTLRRLCGAVMHCMHALKSEGGCGTTEHCPDCVIRNAVETASNGETVHKQVYRMKIQNMDTISEVHLLVTTSPFSYDGSKFILMALEDITEVTNLKRLLPICSSCKNIRNDDGYWEAVHDYLHKTTELEFTHSICPECAKKLYPDLDL